MKKDHFTTLTRVIICILLLHCILFYLESRDAQAYLQEVIVCMGDSITAGDGVSSYENSYVPRLAVLSGIPTINVGVGGTHSGDGVENINSYLEWYKPKILTIYYGNNDAGTYATKEVIANLSYMVDSCLNYGTTPIIATLGPQFGTWAWRQPYIIEINQGIRTLAAAKGIPLADIDIALNWDQQYWADDIHPNDAGHAIIATTFATVTQNGKPPITATIISPSGTISTTTPTYTWNAVSNTTYYQLWVNGSGAWYTASAAGCSSGSGTCSITGSALTAGSYTWYVQTYNNYGGGPWSSGIDFTVSNLPPSCPDLYSWNGSEYVSNGSLYKRTHCPEQENYQEMLVTQSVVAQNNTLTFKIKEVDDEISHTNSVAMYYSNRDTSWTELELISAVHNKGPDLKEYLTKKDNNRAYTAPGDEIMLTYRIPFRGIENAAFKSISSGYYLWTSETWCEILALGPSLIVQPGVIATLQARINNMSAYELPAEARVYFNIWGPGGYSSNNIFSISAGSLAPGNPKWYSLNWTVPDDATAGQYYYSASVYNGKENITWGVKPPSLLDSEEKVVNVNDIVKKRPDPALGYTGPR